MKFLCVSVRRDVLYNTITYFSAICTQFRYVLTIKICIILRLLQFILFYILSCLVQILGSLSMFVIL